MELNKPIPIESYVTPEFSLREMNSLFTEAPKYMGHASFVNQVGDYHVLPSTHNGQVMVKNTENIKVLSNICRHRQAQMLQGSGHVKHLVCPVHQWQYNIDGTGALAHHFTDYQCPNLEDTPLTLFQDFIFQQNQYIIGELESSKHFTAYASKPSKAISVETFESPYNWKIFMEMYLDLYHIQSIHPGLRQFANCRDIDWEIYDNYSSQSVGIHLEEDKQKSPHYKEYVRLIKKIYPNHDHKDLRITWFALYPNIMIEFYPFNMVTSIVIPQRENSSVNVVEFLASKELLDHPKGLKLHDAFKKAYLETAQEDDAACIKIQQGRQALYNNNQEDYGPCQNPLEGGLPSFYQHWHTHMNKHKIHT